MKFRRIVIGATALLALVACSKKQDQEQKELPEYPTTVIAKQNTTLESSFPANVKGQEDIEIRPRIDGFIERIYVDEGSVVSQGQALFKINSPAAEQGLRTAEAAVKAAEAQLHTAQLNVARIKPLADEGIVSVTQLKTYENALESAQAALVQSNAQLRNAKETLGWTEVKSPVNGTVGSIPYRQGSLVNSANVLTTVANTKEVYVYFSISETNLMDILNSLEGNTQAEKLKNLPPVKLQLKDGSIHPEEGRISTIGGQINISTGSAMLRADFPNSEKVLRSGFSGRVIIPTYLENVIVIPQKASFSQQDKILTYKVQGDSVVSTLIDVTPTPDGKSFVINDGLKEGDKIVIDGLATLRNGMKIKAN